VTTRARRDYGPGRLAGYLSAVHGSLGVTDPVVMLAMKSAVQVHGNHVD
jgi:hypothetical protein